MQKHLFSPPLIRGIFKPQKSAVFEMQKQEAKLIEKLDVNSIPDPDPAEEAAIQSILAALDRKWSPEEESEYYAEMNAEAAADELSRQD